jgi:hypothetical protein
MSVARAREINARLRAAGITVHVAPGADSRGNGQTSAYEGGLPHHTASGFAIAKPGAGIYDILVHGRPDLPGPLCNWAGNMDGSLTYIAAHPANHAGASGGRSMGPLPVTSLFNKRVLGLEVVYPGDVPMRDAQYRTALLWSRIVADVVGSGNIERIRAHAETSITGKWDPGFAPGKTINMTAFRRAADIVGTNPVEDDLLYTDPWDDEALNALGPAKLGWALKNIKDNVKATRSMVDTVEPKLAGIAASVAAIAKNPDIDPAELSRVIDAAVAAHSPKPEQLVALILPALSQVVKDVLGEDNAGQADAIVDELVKRLGNNGGN